MMIRFLIIFFSVILLACNNDSNTEPLLLQAPYKEITDSIENAPKNANLYYKRGTILYQNNQAALAEKDFNKAWELEKNEDHALAIATILIKRNTDAAIKFLEEAVESMPLSLPLQISLARGYQQKKDWQKALNVANDVLERYPNQIDALLMKAEILKEQNKKAEALATLEVAYTYAPFDPELSHLLAYEYAEAKNPKVLTLADSLIKADSLGRHAEPYHFKGFYYFNTGNYATAITYFNEAIKTDYNFLSAYMGKGESFYNIKNYAEALKTFELVTTISPTYADAYFWMGKSQEALGQKAEAKLNYQRAFGLDKSFTEAKDAADRL